MRNMPLLSFLKTAALVLVMLGTSLAESKIDGEWVGALPGREGPRTLYFLFKTEGNKLEGEMVDSHGDNQLLDGKITGNDLSFTISYRLSHDTVKRFYKGSVVAVDEIKLTCQAPNGANQNEFSVRRIP